CAGTHARAISARQIANLNTFGVGRPNKFNGAFVGLIMFPEIIGEKLCGPMRPQLLKEIECRGQPTSCEGRADAPVRRESFNVPHDLTFPRIDLYELRIPPKSPQNG